MSLLHPRHVSATAGGKRRPNAAHRMSKTALVGRAIGAATDISTPVDDALEEVSTALHGGLWPHVPRVTEALLTVGAWLARRGSAGEHRRLRRRGSVAHVQEQRLCRGACVCVVVRDGGVTRACALSRVLPALLTSCIDGVGPQPGLPCAMVRAVCAWCSAAPRPVTNTAACPGLT